MFISRKIFGLSKIARICLTSGVVAVLVVTLSCKNEDAPKQIEPVVNLKGTDCLKDSPQIIQRYVNGEASVFEVNSFWNCFHGAISTFMTRVEGSDPAHGYKATELRYFLETNFLGGSQADAIKISDELLAQFMQVKRVIIGGHSQYLTTAELNRLLALFEEFRTMTQELRPYVKTLFKTKKDEKPDPNFVSVASEKFEDVLIRLGDIVAQQRIAYSLNDFKSFVIELDKIFNPRGNGDAFRTVAQYVPVIIAAKGVLFPGNKTVIGPDEWNGFFRFAGYAFSTVIRVNLFISGDSFKTITMLNEIQRMGRGIFQILNEAVARRKDGVLPTVEVENVLFEYTKLRSLPFNMTLAQADEIWMNVVDKIIPEYGTNVPGWSLAEMKRLETEFENLVGVQFYLIGAPRAGVALEAIEEMKGILNTTVLPLDSLNRIIFTVNPTAEWDILSKTKFNFLRLAIRLVMQAYTVDPVRRHALGGVTKDEFDGAYAAAKPFLVLLGIVKEDDTTLGPRIFREANLFTIRANGDNKLNFYEVLEYTNFVYAGIDTGKLMRAALIAPPAGSTGPLCPHTDDSIDTPCFRANYRTLFAQAYANMPKMVAFFATIPEKDWKLILNGFEATNRAEGPALTPISNSDIYETGILLQYIEILMIRYDVDQNGILNLQEGLAALPLFQNILAEILNVDPVADAKEIRALFTYMLKYGEPPDPDKPLTLLRYLNWKWSEKSWKLAADRGIILKILSSLASH